MIDFMYWKIWVLLAPIYIALAIIAGELKKMNDGKS